jgi:hypothetical protein
MSKRQTGALPDVYADGRSKVARRFRALVAAFTSDLGGPLSHSDTALVRQAAAMTVRAEQAQAALLNGRAVNEDQIVRLSNAVTRILTVLGAKQSKRPTRPYGLQDIQAALASGDDDEESAQ